MKNRVLKSIVCGLNWTGASAVVDLLREYNKFDVLGGGFPRLHSAGYMMYGEFNYINETSGIQDVIAENGFGRKKYLDRVKKKYNKKRKKLVTKSVETIIKLLLRAKFNYIPDSIKQAFKLDKTYKSYRNLLDELLRNENYDTRIELSRDWINDVIDNHFDSSQKGVILDQAVTIGGNDSIWMEVLEPFKIILVYRNPKDQFAEQYMHNYFQSKFGGHVKQLHGRGLDDAIDFFVDVTFARMQNIDTFLENHGSENKILMISFESLVREYKGAKKRIENFLSIDNKEHLNPGKYFNPKWSEKNIDIYKDSGLEIKNNKFKNLLEWYSERSLKDTCF